jgi:hypothetical protein
VIGGDELVVVEQVFKHEFAVMACDSNRVSLSMTIW